MTKYIYHTKELRCELKPSGFENQIKLQIQERFFIFWVPKYKQVLVKEGFWGECEDLPLLKIHHDYGIISECYLTGTLDIKRRVNQLFDEYFNNLYIKSHYFDKLKEL